MSIMLKSLILEFILSHPKMIQLLNHPLKLFLALMIDRLHRDGLDPEKHLNIMLRAHLNRGVYSLVARIHSLSAINEMIKAEMKY